MAPLTSNPLATIILGFVGVLGALIIAGFVWRELDKPRGEHDWKGLVNGVLLVLGFMAVAVICLYLVAAWPS
jgi:hypothetical protein